MSELIELKMQAELESEENKNFYVEVGDAEPLEDNLLAGPLKPTMHFLVDHPERNISEAACSEAVTDGLIRSFRTVSRDSRDSEHTVRLVVGSTVTKRPNYHMVVVVSVPSVENPSTTIITAWRLNEDTSFAGSPSVVSLRYCFNRLFTAIKSNDSLNELAFFLFNYLKVSSTVAQDYARRLLDNNGKENVTSLKHKLRENPNYLAEHGCFPAKGDPSENETFIPVEPLRDFEEKLDQIKAKLTKDEFALVMNYFKPVILCPEDPTKDCRANEITSMTSLLYLAAFRGYSEIVKRLIDHGADVTAKRSEHRDFSHVSLMDRILKHGEGRKMSFLTEGLIANVVNAILDRFPGELNCSDAYTPLCRAVYEGHLEIARMFLRHGASVLFPSRNAQTQVVQDSERNSKEETIMSLARQRGTDQQLLDYVRNTPDLKNRDRNLAVLESSKCFIQYFISEIFMSISYLQRILLNTSVAIRHLIQFS
jgi:hypothetical protein